MKLSSRHQSVLIAVTLHVVLLIVLLVHFSSTFYRSPSAYQPKPTNTIQAIAMMSPIKEPIPTPSPVQKTTQVQPPKPISQETKTEAAQQKKAAIAQAQLQAEKLQKLAQLKAAHEKKVALEKKIALQKKLAHEKAIKIQKQKELAMQQKQLQQTMLQQQILSESHDISKVVTKLQQGELDKYKAQIIALIQSNWRIEEVNKNLKCVYRLSLAPDGSVLSVNLMQSSGNDELDYSAKQAILNSAPLPVPEDPELFSHFRELVLSLSPQGVIRG